MNTLEQMYSPEIDDKHCPRDLALGERYQDPIDLHTIYKKEEKEIIAIENNIARLTKMTDSDNSQEIAELKNQSELKREKIAENIITKNLIETLEKNYYINCLVPTNSCIPRILNHLLEKTLKDKFDIDQCKIADINTVFAEIYNNYKGKIEDKSVVNKFPVKLLIKPHEIQILTGDPMLKKPYIVKDLSFEESNPEILLMQNGRGLPICKALCEATDGEFNVRTNEEETEWTYLAKMNY